MADGRIHPGLTQRQAADLVRDAKGGGKPKRTSVTLRAGAAVSVAADWLRANFSEDELDELREVL